MAERAGTTEESNEAMQKYLNRDNAAVSKRKCEAVLPSLQQSSKAGNVVKIEGGVGLSSDRSFALLAFFDEQDRCASTEATVEKWGLIDNKPDPVNMELAFDFSHEQEGRESVESPKPRHLQVEETEENDTDNQGFLEVVSKQVEVDNEQRKTHSSAVGDGNFVERSDESAKKVAVRSREQLGRKTSADDQDAEAAPGKELSAAAIVLEQEAEKPLVEESPRTESCGKQKLGIEQRLHLAEQETSGQSLELVLSLSGTSMAADTGKEGDGGLVLKADEDTAKVIEIGTQAAEAEGRDVYAGEGRDVYAGEGKEIVESPNIVQSNVDVARTSDSMDTRSGCFKLTRADVEDFMAKGYTNVTPNIRIFDTESADNLSNGRNQTASQEDRVAEHLGEQDTNCTSRTLPVVRQTKWWECCGMLSLLLRRDE